MNYADLLPGDVLMKGGKPIFVVLECSRAANVFKWMSLQNDATGKAVDPDLELAGIWDFPVDACYNEVLRGSNVLSRARVRA